MKQELINLIKRISIKSICGLICTIALCATLYQNSFTPAIDAPSDTLVQLVTALAFGCLGLTSVDNIWSKKNNNDNANTKE